MAKMTLQLLRQRCACKEQVDLFKKIFGEEVELTEELAEKYGGLFDVDWAAHTFLTYKSIMAYEKVMIETKAEYSSDVIQSFETDEHLIVVGRAWKKRHITLAKAFVQLYNSQSKN